MTTFAPLDTVLGGMIAANVYAMRRRTVTAEVRENVVGVVADAEDVAELQRCFVVRHGFVYPTRIVGVPLSFPQDGQPNRREVRAAITELTEVVERSLSYGGLSHLNNVLRFIEDLDAENDVGDGLCLL